MENVGLSNIYNIYSVANEHHHPQLLGRVVVTPTEISVLVDYNNSLQELGGPVTPRKLKHLDRWIHGSHTFGASLQEIKEGKYPSLIQEHKLPLAEEKPASPTDGDKWYKVQRDDMKGPMMIKFREGKAYMADSDQAMHPQELNRLLDLTRQGKAVIRHHKPVEQMLDVMKSLSKAEKQEAPDDMTQHLFEDPMSPGIRNRKAFRDSPIKGGVYVMLNANGTGAINKIHGQAVGDDAVRAIGQSIRGTLDEVVSKGHQDVWRMVGDQFMVNLPSKEHASRFLRALRGKLESIPPVGGTHRLSMNAGMGTNPMTARVAMLEAGKTSRAGNHLPGGNPGYAHSLVEGAEGPIPTAPDAPKQP